MAWWYRIYYEAVYLPDEGNSQRKIAHTAMFEMYEARYYPTNLLQDSMNPKGECCPVRAYAVLSGHIICTRHSNLCLAFFGRDHCSQATIVNPP